MFDIGGGEESVLDLATKALASGLALASLQMFVGCKM